MKTAILLLSLVSSPALALTCQTKSPNFYDVTLNEQTCYMNVMNGRGRIYKGVAYYNDIPRKSDVFEYYYLPVTWHSGFKLEIREGIMPNWYLCPDSQHCFQCYETR
jgi:hypothetical protein